MIQTKLNATTCTCNNPATMDTCGGGCCPFCEAELSRIASLPEEERNEEYRKLDLLLRS